MQIKKDVQAVLYSFGATALVLGMGASAYYRQPPVVEIPDVIVLETPLEEVSAIAPQTETAVMVSDDVDTGDDEEADDNDGDPRHGDSTKVSTRHHGDTNSCGSAKASSHGTSRCSPDSGGHRDTNTDCCDTDSRSEN
jgi:hypothetical protein